MLTCSALSPRRLLDMLVILPCFIFPPFPSPAPPPSPGLPGSAASLGRCGFWKVSPCLQSRDLIVSRQKKIYPHVTEEARGGQQELRDGENKAWFNGETVKLPPPSPRNNPEQVNGEGDGVWCMALLSSCYGHSKCTLWLSLTSPPPAIPYTQTHRHTHTHTHTHSREVRG